MSVVAWDGITMAGDLQITTHEGTTLKGPSKVGIQKGDDYSIMWGIVGSFSYGMRLLTWFLSEDMEYPRKMYDEQDASLIVVRSDKPTIQLFEGDMFPVHFAKDRAFALGSGAEVALGAMYAGASAAQAAEIACELNDGCGKGTTSFTFDGGDSRVIN